MILDMYNTFASHTDYKTALMTDTLHPNLTGYATMGDAWYATIRSLLHPR
jgi:lysophospholipase L1-like esterase